MADDKKAPTPAPRDDKNKVSDLPSRDASGKDDQVKGGRMPLKPKP
jgi:hypothetical protein